MTGGFLLGIVNRIAYTQFFAVAKDGVAQADVVSITHLHIIDHRAVASVHGGVSLGIDARVAHPHAQILQPCFSGRFVHRTTEHSMDRIRMNRYIRQVQLFHEGRVATANQRSPELDGEVTTLSRESQQRTNRTVLHRTIDRTV